MDGKQYKLEFLPLFEDDLNEIVDYIAFHLNNPAAAYRLIDEIQDAIRTRLNCPESFEPYPSAKPRPYPYYRIYVKNYTIFYVVIDNVMQVRRILYSRRDFDAHI